MSYINSNANRFYAALEASYGVAAGVTAANRFPAVRIEAHQALQISKRLDKTGTRTYLGSSADAPRKTAFSVATYLTSWAGTGQPAYGPLVQAALGAPPQQVTAPLTVAAVVNNVQVTTNNMHGLSVGMAIATASDIRFVTAVVNPYTVVINAPFAGAAGPGTPLTPAISYPLSTTLPSVTLYDY